MISKELMYGLSLLSPAILLAGVIIGAVHFRKNPSVGRLIFWYLVCALFVDVLSRYWGLLSGSRNNLIFLSITGVIDLAFFSLLYNRYFGTKKMYVLPVLSILVLAGVTCNMCYKGFGLTEAAEYQSYDKLVCDGLIVLYALRNMYDLLSGKGPLKTEVIRVNGAVLLFFSLDLLISLATNFLINAGLHFVIYFWIIRLALLTTLYTILIYTLWLTGKNPKHWHYG